MSSVPDVFQFLSDEGRASSQIRKGCFVIGIAGGSASGKTSVCREIMSRLKGQRIDIISQDSFYRGLTDAEHEDASNYDFDHPDAFDWEGLATVLRAARKGKQARVPSYCFNTHRRLPEDQWSTLYGADVILVEGILMFFDEKIRSMMDMKLFVDTDADVRLSRRILRDIRDRGRELEGVLVQYERFVKPAFDTYIMPTKKYADVIIPRGSSNRVAIDLIVHHTEGRLKEAQPWLRR